MATVTKGKTFVSGEVVTPTKLHDMVDLATVTAIVNADIDAAAAIAAPKLASVLDLSTKSVTLANGEVSAAELAATLDLSAKTLTLPDNVVTTGKIADSTSTTTGVTNAKIRQAAALSVIGNATNATAAPADIAASTDGHVLRRSGTGIGFGAIVNGATTATSTNTASAIVARDASGNFTAGTVTASLTGNVTGNLTGTASGIADAVVTTAKIADSSSTTTGVTNAKIRQSAALSVIGNSTNATAAPADIAAASDGHVMRRSGTAIGFGTITGTGIAAGVSLSYPTLTGVREAIVNLGAVSGSQTFNLQSGNIFQVKPNGAITVAPSNVPSSGTFVGMLIRHEGDGAARTYTWPGTTKWAYGETPSMTSTIAKFDLVSLFTYDGGTTWFGQILGQNY